MKFTKYDMLEIDAEIWFIVCDLNQIKIFIEQLVKDDFDKSEYENCMGLTWTKNKKSFCFINIDKCKPEEYKSTMMHEIIHGVHFILDAVGQPLDYTSGTEMLAYYVSYYIEKGMDFLDGLNKKQGQKKSITKNEKK